MSSSSVARYKAKGFVQKILSASLMGGIGAFARYINAPGDFVSFGRQFVGFLSLTIAFFFIKGMWHKVKTMGMSPAIVSSGINLGLLSGLYVISTQYTTLANAALLIYTGPVYATILAAIFLKEKINIQRALSLTTVVVGMLFAVGVITPDGITFDLSPTYAFGNGIALLSGVAYGLFLFSARYRTDADSDARSWWQFMIASITLLCLMAVDSFLSGGLKYTVKVGGVAQIDESGQIIVAEWSPFTMDTQSWIVWACAAFISGFVAFHLLTHAAKILTANELAAVSYWEVIMAAILGWVLFGEAMDLFQVIGACMIVGGGAVQVMFTTKESHVAEEHGYTPDDLVAHSPDEETHVTLDDLDE